MSRADWQLNVPGTLNLRQEMAQTEHGLRFTVRPAMSIDMKTGKMRSCWEMEIHRISETPTGRPGKAVLLMRLASSDGEGPADLLKVAAQCYEQGDVEVKQ